MLFRLSFYQFNSLVYSVGLDSVDLNHYKLGLLTIKGCLDCAISVGSCGFAGVGSAQVASLGVISISNSVKIIGLIAKVKLHT